MEAMKLVAVLVVVAVAYGLPLNDQQGKNLITGVFIPSDAFKNLQDRANANSPNNNQVQNPQPNYQPVNTNQPQYQPVNTNQPANTNQPQYQPTVMTNQPPAQNNQQPTNNQPILVQPPIQNNQVPVLTNLQPTVNSQPSVIYTQQPLTANRDPNQAIMVMTNQPNNQPNQPIVLMQQPPTSSNQPIYVQQPNQQPTQMIIATNPNPSNGNQMQGTWVQSPNQNQPGSTVYTLIPLNSQNNNMNSNSAGSYLIPVQSGSQNPIILSTGK